MGVKIYRKKRQKLLRHILLSTMRKITQEGNMKKKKQLKGREPKGFTGIQIMPSSGRQEGCSRSTRGEANSMTRQYFMLPFKKRAGQIEAVK